MLRLRDNKTHISLLPISLCEVSFGHAVASCCLADVAIGSVGKVATTTFATSLMKISTGEISICLLRTLRICDFQRLFKEFLKLKLIHELKLVCLYNTKLQMV